MAVPPYTEYGRATIRVDGRKLRVETPTHILIIRADQGVVLSVQPGEGTYVRRTLPEWNSALFGDRAFSTWGGWPTLAYLLDRERRDPQITRFEEPDGGARYRVLSPFAKSDKDGVDLWISGETGLPTRMRSAWGAGVYVAKKEWSKPAVGAAALRVVRALEGLARPHSDGSALVRVRRRQGTTPQGTAGSRRRAWVSKSGAGYESHLHRQPIAGGPVLRAARVIRWRNGARQQPQFRRSCGSHVQGDVRHCPWGRILPRWSRTIFQHASAARLSATQGRRWRIGLLREGDAGEAARDEAALRSQLLAHRPHRGRRPSPGDRVRAARPRTPCGAGARDSRPVGVRRVPRQGRPVRSLESGRRWKLRPGRFRLLFVLHDSDSKELDLGVLWFAEEGSSLTVLRVQGSRFVAIKHGYRYQAPM